MNISDNGLKFIEDIEGGFHGGIPYDDAHPDRVLQSGDKIDGTLTGPYGLTGGDVTIGRVWTEEEAKNDLLERLQAVQNVLNDQSVVRQKLSQNQFDSLCSFIWNIGIEGFKNSGVLQQLNQGNYANVPARMAEWNETTVGGKKIVSPGLIARRAKESALWSTHGADEPIMVSMSVTPTVQINQKNLWTSVTNAGVVLAGVPGILAVHADDITNTASQLTNLGISDQHFALFCHGLSVTGICLGLYGRFRIKRDHGV